MYKTVIKKILNKLSSIGGNTAYYPGCLTKFAGKHIEENYKKILTNIGIDFITLPEFRCCGSPVLSAGYKKDFDSLVEQNKEIFRKYSVKRLITNCPTCFKMFGENTEGIQVQHITQVLADNLTKLPARKHHKEYICYHDPCHLGRHSGVYEEPRKILRLLGFNITEMKPCKEDALCCGGGGGVKSNDNDLANKIAKIRLKQCKEKKIVTPCPMCYKHLKENAKGIEVFELSEVIV